MENTMRLFGISADEVRDYVESVDFNDDINPDYHYEIVDTVDKLTERGILNEIQDAFDSGYFAAEDAPYTKIEAIVEYIYDGLVTFG